MEPPALLALPTWALAVALVALLPLVMLKQAAMVALAS